MGVALDGRISPCKPFLKWPGGKYRLVKRIRESLQSGRRLIEPFVGSGAVFLNTDYDRYILADNNQDLINLYETLRREGLSFIDYCRSFFVPEYNRSEIYYGLRALFNQTTDQNLKSALFVYLNRHCYNGLCRYNSQGVFNTPFGRYRRPRFPEGEMQVFVRQARRARFFHRGFTETMSKARRGDVVYCDPPYAPLTDTAYFTAYSAGGFGWDKQVQLAEAAERLASRGVPVVISNHAIKEIRKLYSKARVSEFPVQRFISCDATNRGTANELLAVFGEDDFRGS